MAGVADKNALKAGIFIIIALAMGLTVFFLVAGSGLGRGQSWTVRFDVDDDVGGVGPGADVRVGGVTVGKVQRVRLSDDLGSVDVDIALPGDIRLRQGANVVIQTTVTGTAWLNFDTLGQGEPLARGSIIQGEAGTFSNLVAAVNRLTPAVTSLVDDVRGETVPRVNEVLGKTSRTMDSVEGTVQRFGDAADRTASAAATVDELVQKNRENLDRTLANLREVSDQAPELVENANLLVNKWADAADSVRTTLEGTGEKLNAVLEDAEVIAEDMKGIGQDTQSTIREVHGLIAGNRGKIEQIINRMRDTSATLSLAAAEIRRSPWRLLYRPDGSQRESLDLYDAARRFAEGANALQDAAVALSDAANDQTANPEQVEALLLDLQRRFQEFERMERLLYERLSE